MQRLTDQIFTQHWPDTGSSVAGARVRGLPRAFERDIDQPVGRFYLAQQVRTTIA